MSELDDIAVHCPPPPLPPPVHEEQKVRLYQGDSLSLLRSFRSESVCHVVTDPPYSSGGFTRSDRAQRTEKKYSVTGTQRAHAPFSGDSRDQLSFSYWCSLWLAECHRIARPEAVLMCFIDWRQLPALAQAIQAGGWVWRGIVPWNKTGAAKPQRGYFRGQCEYVLHATKGTLGPEQKRQVPVCAPGFFTHAVNAREKNHQTGKPVALLQDLMQIFRPGSIILDPFAGGGSTLVAARNLGHFAIGIETESENIAAARAFLSQSVLALPL